MLLNSLGGQLQTLTQALDPEDGIPFVGDVFVTAAAFDGESDLLFFGVRDDLVEGFPGALDVEWPQFFAFLDELVFQFDVFAGVEVSDDVAEEVHVHGYDVRLDVDPGETVRTRFTADVRGEQPQPK